MRKINNTLVITYKMSCKFFSNSPVQTLVDKCFHKDKLQQNKNFNERYFREKVNSTMKYDSVSSLGLGLFNDRSVQLFFGSDNIYLSIYLLYTKQPLIHSTFLNLLSNLTCSASYITTCLSSKKSDISIAQK